MNLGGATSDIAHVLVKLGGLGVHDVHLVQLVLDAAQGAFEVGE